MGCYCLGCRCIGVAWIGQDSAPGNFRDAGKRVVYPRERRSGRVLQSDHRAVERKRVAQHRTRPSPASSSASIRTMVGLLGIDLPRRERVARLAIHDRRLVARWGASVLLDGLASVAPVDAPPQARLAVLRPVDGRPICTLARRNRSNSLVLLLLLRRRPMKLARLAATVTPRRADEGQPLALPGTSPAWRCGSVPAPSCANRTFAAIKMTC